MAKSLAVALAAALHSASAAVDVSAFVQSTVVRHSGNPAKKNYDEGWAYKPGQRVELEGYGKDINITIISRGKGKERYNLIMDSETVYPNIEGKFLKSWQEIFPQSNAPDAGPVAHIMNFDSKSKPRMVKKGSNPGTWDVYVPGNGLVPNVPDSDIIREKSWYQSRTHKGEHGPAAVLVGKKAYKPAEPVEQPAEQPAAQPAQDSNGWSDAELQALQKGEQPEQVALGLAEKSRKVEGAVAEASAEGAPASEVGEPEGEAEEEEEPVPAPAEVEATGNRHFVVLQPGDAGKLGFSTRLYKGMLPEQVVLVESIKKRGALEKWNAQNPSQKLSVGDRVLMINGMGGNAISLTKMLAKLQNGETPPPEVKLLVEKLTVSSGSAIKKTLDMAMQMASKGPNKFLREALPMDIGKVLFNEQTTVRHCGDITSQLYCQTSHSKYNIDCAGWTGSKCVSKEEVTGCDIFTSLDTCHKSKAKFGIECAGWGGSGCLDKDAHPKLITSESICTNAEKRLGILVAGWGGQACLTKEAACSEITLPGICNGADAKLGLKCLGWGGSSCLGEGSTATQITTENLCKKASEKFGIDVAGWGGSTCLTSESTCDMITEPNICNHAKSRLGIECAGWGGSACLEKGATVDQITSESICGRSAEALGIESGGWSGSACLRNEEVKCSAITHSGICRDAASRLGIDCAGWSGKECLAPEDAQCRKLTTKSICYGAEVMMGAACIWNGDQCLPDPAGAH